MLKVYLRCQSLTLNASLQRMLKDFLVPEQEAQFIITDHHIEADKPYLYISRDQDADIVKPFTNASLLLALERFSQKLNFTQANTTPKPDKELSQAIKALQARQQQELMELIQSYYKPE